MTNKITRSRNTQEEYNKIHKNGQELLQKLNFKGEVYRICNKWFGIIPLFNRPIKYLEIGTYFGANAISVANTYGKENGSEIHCIDPWDDYDEYDEYKNLQTNTYNTFLENISNSGLKDKFKIHRGFSHEQLHKFKDSLFDMIYIDANHESHFVLEDAVLSYRKLKKGGYMIFDDIDWKDVTTGVEAFITAYDNHIKIITCHDFQLFIQKL